VQVNKRFDTMGHTNSASWVSGICAWGARSRVVDGQGNLLTVYRGQHGTADHWEETVLGSLSFGSAKGASDYALHPNRRDMAVHAPKVFPVFLDIINPFIVHAQDPFLDLSRYAEVFGMDETARIALKYRDYVCRTNAWEDVGASYGTLENLIQAQPESLLELYFEIYLLLDEDDEVARLRDKGFDGAIHGGSGATAMETEYRVFSSAQVRSVWDRTFHP
jgi:hypothetical protein